MYIIAQYLKVTYLNQGTNSLSGLNFATAWVTSTIQWSSHLFIFYLKGLKKWSKQNINAYLSSMWWYRAQSNNTLDNKTVDLHYCSLMSQFQTTTNECNRFLELNALYNPMWRTFTTSTVWHKWQPLYNLVIEIATRACFSEVPQNFQALNAICKNPHLLIL